MPFSMENLDWRSYPTVKNFDGQTSCDNIIRAMAPDSVYDLPTGQLYLCHPHAVQLLAIAHFRRLPHEHGTLPQQVQDAPSLPVFRRELKTVLFQSSFPAD